MLAYVTVIAYRHLMQAGTATTTATARASNVHFRLTVTLPNLAAIQLRALGLEVGASKAQVKAAWREAVKKAHPDLGGSPDAVRKLYELRDGLKETGLM